MVDDDRQTPQDQSRSSSRLSSVCGPHLYRIPGPCHLLHRHSQTTSIPLKNTRNINLQCMYRVTTSTISNNKQHLKQHPVQTIYLLTYSPNNVNHQGMCHVTNFTTILKQQSG